MGEGERKKVSFAGRGFMDGKLGDTVGNAAFLQRTLARFKTVVNEMLHRYS